MKKWIYFSVLLLITVIIYILLLYKCPKFNTFVDQHFWIVWICSFFVGMLIMSISQIITKDKKTD